MRDAARGGRACWIVLLGALVAGCADYSENMKVSRNGKAKASVRFILPLVHPDTFARPYQQPTDKKSSAAKGAMPPEIVASADTEIATEIARMGAVKESLATEASPVGREIRGEFDLGSLVQGRQEDEASPDPDAESSRHCARPTIRIEGGEMTYERNIPASYFVELSQRAWRHGLRYTADQKMTWSFCLELPWPAVREETNGQIEADRFVMWKYEAGDLMKNGLKMRATCREVTVADELPRLIPYMVAFLLGVGLVVALGLYGLKRCLEQGMESGTPPEFRV